MKRTLHALIYVFLINHSFAQIEFKPIYGKFDILNQRFKVSKVVDARTFKDFGVVKIDEKTEQVININEEFEEFLPIFIDFCSDSKSKTQTDLTLKINEYQFGTREVNKKTWVWFYADIEFYQKKGTGFQKIFEVNECVEGKGSLNLETLIGKLHWQYWQSLITKLNEIKQKNLPNNQEISYSELLLPKENPKILTDSVSNTGIFVTFSLFKANNIIKKDFEIGDRDGDITLLLKDEKGIFKRTTVEQSYWGFCDKKVLYVSVRKTEYAADIFIPLLRFGNTFELVKGISDSKVNMAANSKIINNQIGAIYSSAYFMTRFRPFGMPSGVNLGIGLVQLLLASSQNNPNQRVMINMTNGKLQPVQIFTFYE